MASSEPWRFDGGSPPRSTGRRRRTTGREQRAPDVLPRQRDREVERLSRSRRATVPVPAPSFATDLCAGAPPASASNGAGDNAAVRNSTSDLFSVFRARLAANAGREPDRRRGRCCVRRVASWRASSRRRRAVADGKGPRPSVAAKNERRRIPCPVPGRNFFVPG